MNLVAKKEAIGKLVERLMKSNEREDGLKRELANDRATLERIDDMVDNGDLLPEDCAYDTFIHWREAMEKQVNTGEKSIHKIMDQKLEVEALQFYLDNVAE